MRMRIRGQNASNCRGSGWRDSRVRRGLGRRLDTAHGADRCCRPLPVIEAQGASRMTTVAEWEARRVVGREPGSGPGPVRVVVGRVI